MDTRGHQYLGISLAGIPLVFIHRHRRRASGNVLIQAAVCLGKHSEVVNTRENRHI